MPRAYTEDKRCVEYEIILRGYSGHGFRLKSGWYTQNKTTLVLGKIQSVVLKHNGCSRKEQINLLYSVESFEELIGKYITISVWARCLKINNNGIGGTLAIICDSHYNKGEFYKHISFSNMEWSRISLTVKVPDKIEGLIVCLRANKGTGDIPAHSEVEFCSPKLELGVFSTSL